MALGVLEQSIVMETHSILYGILVLLLVGAGFMDGMQRGTLGNEGLCCTGYIVVLPVLGLTLWGLWVKGCGCWQRTV